MSWDAWIRWISSITCLNRHPLQVGSSTQTKSCGNAFHQDNNGQSYYTLVIFRPMAAFKVEMEGSAESLPARFIAFAGNRRIASGEIREIALKVKKVLDKGEDSPILIFDDKSSELIEIDFRGSIAEVERRLVGKSDVPVPPQESRGPGRPKLGVIGREVTLLPRHWD